MLCHRHLDVVVVKQAPSQRLGLGTTHRHRGHLADRAVVRQRLQPVVGQHPALRGASQVVATLLPGRAVMLLPEVDGGRH